MILSFIYILVVAVGVGWIAYRIKNHLRIQRQREQNLGLLFSDDQFKAYLEALKNKADNPAPDTRSGTGSAADQS